MVLRCARVARESSAINPLNTDTFYGLAPQCPTKHGSSVFKLYLTPDNSNPRYLKPKSISPWISVIHLL